jgi:hypothetical protein
MREKVSLIILNIFLGVFVLLAFNTQVTARLVGNFSESSFDEQDRGQINTNVMEAAGYFLKSQSDMFLFLTKIERSDLEGTDFSELQSIIENAVIDMRNANTKYRELTVLANRTSYNQEVLNRLTAFNYAAFKNSKGLNSVIYDDVKVYLQIGDVRGIYHKLWLDTQQILHQLNVIKSAVDAGMLPDMQDVWQTNRAYSNTFLFGQYIAEIFYEITGK